MSRRFIILAGTVVLTASAAGVAFRSLYESPRERFVHELDLVAFSTSMIGGPAPNRLEAAHNEAQRLNVDLFAAYLKHQDNDKRINLAYLLIETNSPNYFVTLANISTKFLGPRFAFGDRYAGRIEFHQTRERNWRSFC
jgi:hypothetical protein